MSSASDIPSTERKAYMQAFRARQKQAGHTRATVNLAPDEHARLTASAKRHGEKIATHVKSLALAKLDDRYLVPPDLSERLDELLAVVRGIGNNLNQLARHSNEMRAFMDTREVQLQLRRLDGEVRRFISVPPKEEGRRAGDSNGEGAP
jgi:nitrate reductase beta subunit